MSILVLFFFFQSLASTLGPSLSWYDDNNNNKIVKILAYFIASGGQTSFVPEKMTDEHWGMFFAITRKGFTASGSHAHPLDSILPFINSIALLGKGVLIVCLSFSSRPLMILLTNYDSALYQTEVCLKYDYYFTIRAENSIDEIPLLLSFHIIILLYVRFGLRCMFFIPTPQVIAGIGHGDQSGGPVTWFLKVSVGSSASNTAMQQTDHFVK